MRRLLLVLAFLGVLFVAAGCPDGSMCEEEGAQRYRDGEVSVCTDGRWDTYTAPPRSTERPGIEVQGG